MKVSLSGAEIVGVDHAAFANLVEDVADIRLRDGEAAIAAAQHAATGDNVFADILCRMNDHGARQGVVVARVKPAKTDRAAMLADIDIVGAKRAGRRRL